MESGSPGAGRPTGETLVAIKERKDGAGGESRLRREKEIRGKWGVRPED